jgi:ribosomal protein S18 acetylase RimI-like enzyme
LAEVLEMCGCRNFTRLGPRDADRYADHLLRLSDKDRRLRFFGDAEDFLIEIHAGAAASDKRIVVICEEDGVIRAAAELLADPTRPEVGELAFTVEGDCQRKGMGSALMKEVIDAGVQAGFERLELEILPDNESMLALARRFFERIEARDGRLFASINLAEVTPRSASA